MDKAEAFLHRYLHTSTRGGIEAVLVVLVLVSAEPTPKSLLYGSCISAVGLLVRLWAAGYVLEAGALNGPYRFVRQPHLLGTALLFFGLCLAGRNALVAACAVTLLAVFHSRAYGRLDSHTAVRLQTAFAAYKEHVPALVPRLWPYPGLGRGRGRVMRPCCSDLLLCAAPPRFVRCLNFSVFSWF